MPRKSCESGAVPGTRPVGKPENSQQNSEYRDRAERGKPIHSLTAYSLAGAFAAKELGPARAPFFKQAEEKC